jgi:hypothetical protein
LVGAATASAQGQPRSTFVPRHDARPVSAKIVPTQATAQPPMTTPGTAPPTTTPGGGAPNQPYSIPKEDLFRTYVRLDPPGREKLFGSRDTEAELEERMRQEAKDGGRQESIVFPDKADLTQESYKGRQFPPTRVLAEPAYIVYEPLFFEDRNSERFGWELGPIQPLVSTAIFFKDVFFLPLHCGSAPHRCWETNAGQCKPGDPVPYTWYPPEVTWTGVVYQAGAIALLSAPLPRE